MSEADLLEMLALLAQAPSRFIRGRLGFIKLDQ
jgi:hypothetical protein